MPAVTAGVGEREAGIGLGARLVAGGGIAGLDLIGLAAVLGAECDGQGPGQADVEGAADVQGVGPLRGDEIAGVEVAGGRTGVRIEVDIGRVGDVHRVAVVAVGRTEVPVPAGGDTLEPGGCGEVLFLELVDGVEAVGVQGGQLGGHAEIGPAAGVLAAIGPEGIGLDAAQVVAGVEAEQGQLVAGVAEDLVHIGIASEVGPVRVGAGLNGLDHALVGAAAVAVVVESALGCEVQEARRGGAEAGVAVEPGGRSAAIVVAATGGRHRSAGRVGLQDDVDHPGDGVRAILGGGAVLEHLDVIDGGDRDHVQVGRRAALEHAGQDGEVGRAVPPLAIDQHQDVVGAEAAQPRRQGLVGHVTADGLGVERRRAEGQGLDQPRRAHSGQGRRSEHLDGCGAIHRPKTGDAGAGDDDLLHGGRLAGGGRQGCAR